MRSSAITMLLTALLSICVDIFRKVSLYGDVWKAAPECGPNTYDVRHIQLELKDASSSTAWHFSHFSWILSLNYILGGIVFLSTWLRLGWWEIGEVRSVGHDGRFSPTRNRFLRDSRQRSSRGKNIQLQRPTNSYPGSHYCRHHHVIPVHCLCVWKGIRQPEVDVASWL